ncbi:MAG: CvpA family protein [Candidatus Omnitrophica bacterium]|nr:CvpA family protein [Candidatus Omnitrophota bacterium]MCM8790809.1 CvpA family protein [Candidatus Omnitrophota bacterium]
MEIFTKLNWVDVLIIIVMLRISYVALQDGLSHEIFPLIGTIGTAVIALHYYHKIAVFISKNVISLPVAFLDFLTFLVLVVAFGFIFKFLRIIVDKLIKVTWHPLAEKFGGLICGILRASVVTSVILIVLALMPLPYLQWSIRDRSLSGMYFLRIAPTVHSKLSWVLPTIRLGEGSVGGEGMVQEIVSEKSLAQKK